MSKVQKYTKFGFKLILTPNPTHPPPPKKEKEREREREKKKNKHCSLDTATKEHYINRVIQGYCLDAFI